VSVKHDLDLLYPPSFELGFPSIPCTFESFAGKGACFLPFDVSYFPHNASWALFGPIGRKRRLSVVLQGGILKDNAPRYPGIEPFSLFPGIETRWRLGGPSTQDVGDVGVCPADIGAIFLDKRGSGSLEHTVSRSNNTHQHDKGKNAP